VYNEVEFVDQFATCRARAGQGNRETLIITDFVETGGRRHGCRISTEYCQKGTMLKVARI
jgi:hypothetical protein